MGAIDIIIIAIAAAIAGMINSVAGGGTLVSFPALIWIGVDPVVANATNTVAVWPGAFAAMLGYRQELASGRRFIALLIAPSLIGGVLGAVLLLRTPTRVFVSIVPFLILGATLLIALQDPIARLLGLTDDARRSRHFYAGAMAFQLLVAIYGGYFGAGIGILMLAALGFLGLTDIHRMNAIKTLLGASINGVAALYFAASGAVNWRAGLVMAIAAMIGGYGGAGLAKRLGKTFVRRTIVVIGLLMALALFLKGR
ncbi:MAG: sulfite exporter TauE/SafE family protein [Vicinamibacteria bacterium]|jgi:hypothetical protein|nr:sulfite exporter TauE/SafE family protein [Vicinamibacteria bacterium]